MSKTYSFPSTPALPSRRQFIRYTVTAAGVLAVAGPALAAPRRISPNEKLNIGIIGAGGKGATDTAGVAGENIIALCDVDANTLHAAAEKHPGAKLYRDYRKMIEEMKEIDAVTVSIPDHHHAPAAIRAIKSGKHVYVQKPLTHTIWEARQLTEAARKYKVASQMGNQGHSGEGNRQVCEVIWAGAIGDVREVHCWTNRPIWPQGLERPQGSDPVPDYLDWDAWLGPAPVRPYKGNQPDEGEGKETNDKKKKKEAKRRAYYHPFSWRGWWDFGCGALGDMGCHVMDGAVWALKLGHASSVEVVASSPVNSEQAPQWSVIRYQFPARGKMPPVTLTWHDGGKLPEKPAEMEAEKFEQSGTLFIGSKGKMLAGTYGEGPRLLPESHMKDFQKPAPTISRVPENNPYLDWIRACKGGPPACSNFDVAGPFTEIVLLGNLALRLGKKLEWDGPKMKAKNAPEADPYIHKKYRKGWEV